MARTTLAHALLAALTLGVLLPVATPAAHAGDAQVCILRSIESRTAPKKPNIFETVLDCGPAPTPQQEALAAEVNNAMNAAAALEVMVRAGYEIEASSWRDSFTGRQELGIYTLVVGQPDRKHMGGKGKGPKKGPPADLPDAEAAPEADVPVSEESSLDLPPADESADDEPMDDEAEAEKLLGN
ncbi:MAG: hypothetical protein H6732_10035 [Alphaproteobacteria bacterium]|nr:hypothetical protein [Alphaproteobacteria bacterium]